MGWDDSDSHVECNGAPFQKFHIQSIRCSIHMEARIMQALPIPLPTTLLSMVKTTLSFLQCVCVCGGGGGGG